MKFQIDWAQNSTKRGAIWLGAALIGLILLIAGRPDGIPNLLLLAGAVAGGMGVALRD